MRRGNFKHRLVLMAWLATVTGCAINPQVTQMTPPVPELAGKPSGKTLKVMPFKEGESFRTSFAKWGIKAESFQEALVRTLKKTGLFKEVFTSQEGDYLLHPTLISFDVNPERFSPSVHLFVNYRVMEARSGKEVWKGNLYSQATAGAREGLKRAYEEAVKSNLSQLAQKLSRSEL